MDIHPVMLHGHSEFLGLRVVDLTPPAIGPNETVTQSYTAPGAHLGDFVLVTTLASFNGTCIVGAFVTAPGRIDLTWLNTHNQTVTPEPAPGLLLLLRRPGLVLEPHVTLHTGD